MESARRSVDPPGAKEMCRGPDHDPNERTDQDIRRVVHANKGAANGDEEGDGHQRPEVESRPQAPDSRLPERVGSMRGGHGEPCPAID